MKYISVFFLIFVIAVIVLADNGNLPYSIRALYDFPNGDKIGHFILFGLFDFVLTCAILSSRPFKYPVRVTLSIGLILALFLPKFFFHPHLRPAGSAGRLCRDIHFSCLVIFWNKPRV
jgi:hypothetical protein